MYPGLAIARGSDVDGHHGLARFSWRMVGPQGAPIATGLDIVDFGPAKNLERVIGFFDAPDLSQEISVAPDQQRGFF